MNDEVATTLVMTMTPTKNPSLASIPDFKFIPKIPPAKDTIEHANNAAVITKSIFMSSFRCRSKIIEDTASVFSKSSFNMFARFCVAAECM